MDADPLAEAWSAREPGPMEHPGPRGNRWPGPPVRVHARSSAVPVAAMTRALWWSECFHPDPATGLPGTVRQRAIPSAGGCYPVQLHLLCGDGCDVPPGAYAFDAGSGHLIRRGGAGGTAPQVPAGLRGAVVVFTVLPQRTAAKYHHRTLPLLMADTAYAAAGLAHHAASRGVPAACLRGEPRALAAALGMPGYPEWLECWPDTAPEIPLAAVALGHGSADGTFLDFRGQGARAAPSPVPPEPQPEREPRVLSDVERWLSGYRPVPGVFPYGGLAGIDAGAMAARRSAALQPEVGATAVGAGGLLDALLAEAVRACPFAAPPGCRTLLIDGGQVRGAERLRGLPAHCAGQEWIETLDGLLLFQAPEKPGVEEMWWAASLAAHVLFGGHARRDRPAFRPVGGWTGTLGGNHILHGLGMRTAPTAAPPLERTGHAG